MADLRAPVPLVLLAQAGDRGALERLFAAIQQPLYDYLAGLVRDRHLAEDLLQEVFVLIWRKLGWLRDPQLFRPWVYRIATRHALRCMRKKHLPQTGWEDRQLDTMAHEQPPESIGAEWLERLPSLLEGVSPASRAVLILHYLQGLSLDEVAAALDLPAGTVKSRLSYGLSALRQKVGRPGDLT